MGATSVTGVGQGSVEGQNMGSKSWTIGSSRVLGPRVVAAGTVTLSDTTGTVILPLFPGVVGNYICMVTDVNATPAATGAGTDLRC